MNIKVAALLVIIIVVAAVAIISLDSLGPAGQFFGPGKCYYKTVDGDFIISNVTEYSTSSCKYSNDSNYDPFFASSIYNGFRHDDSCITTAKLEEWSCESTSINNNVKLFVGENLLSCETDCDNPIYGESNVSITINNGDAETHGTDVTLYLTRTGSIVEYRVWNDGEVEPITWISVPIQLAWSVPHTLLDGTDGVRRVYMKARNSTGYEVLRDDTISLKTKIIDILDLQPEEGKDVYVNQEFPTINYDGESLAVGQWTNKRSLLQFDLSDIYKKNDVKILGAQLILHTVGGNYNDMTYVYRVTFPWTENSVTWENQPPHNGALQANANIANSTNETNSTITYDLTQLVQGWVDEEFTNYGVKIISKEIAIPETMSFYSSDWGARSLRPRLRITYQYKHPDADVISAQSGDEYCGDDVCEGGDLVTISENGLGYTTRLYNEPVTIDVVQVISHSSAMISINEVEQEVKERVSYIINGIPVFIDDITYTPSSLKVRTEGYCTLGCSSNACVKSKRVLICDDITDTKNIPSDR
ncbi:MAG: DNRLRE domain-containing protein [Candidatus Aenigmatarchaeota archaeon]